MNKYWWLVIGGIGAFACVISYAAIKNNRFALPDLPPASSSPEVEQTPLTTPQATVVSMPSGQDYYYPMTNYSTRMTNRWYGKIITEKDNDTLPCGMDFSGLHTGDDLEVTANKLTVDMPVYAIADGIVRQVSSVGGYGGLLITEHELNNEKVTAYYGHIAIPRTTVKAGDSIKAGQQLSVLGSACSAQTSGERKHLHFSIHRGAQIDVKGYIPSREQLNNWFNPKDILEALGAQEPS